MSEPALKRQLAEALLKIKQLEQAAPKEVVKTVIEYREREVIREVKQPKETVVIEKPVDRSVYVDKPYPVHVPVVEYRDRVIEKIVATPPKVQIEYIDREVVRVETKTETEVIEKQVYVPVEVIKEVIKEVYVDNPEHLKTIALLQEKLCQFTSQ